MFRHSRHEKKIRSLFDAEHRCTNVKRFFSLAASFFLYSYLRETMYKQVAETSWSAMGKISQASSIERCVKIPSVEEYCPSDFA